MDNLKEIRRGETGTGLLIENDGYISPEIGDNKHLFESYKVMLNEGDLESLPDPFVVDAVFQKYGIENANGRIYPEDILKKAVDKYQDLIKNRMAIGECNHPDESVIDLSRVAINIIELHWEKNTLVGKMEIPVTNGFRKYGIISCQADQVAHLILSGIKIGVSSRGLGSVTSKMGTLYVSDDYEIVCWDVVSTPSTPGAYIARDKKDLTQYIEGKENQSKGTLIDSLDSFNDWLSNF